MVDARESNGPEPPAAKQGQNQVANLNRLTKFSGLEILEKCLHLQQMFGKIMKIKGIEEFCVGINDHNVTCQYVWRTDDLSIACSKMVFASGVWVRCQK